MFFFSSIVSFGRNMIPATIKTIKAQQNGALESRAINNQPFWQGKHLQLCSLCFHLQKSNQKHRCDGNQQRSLFSRTSSRSSKRWPGSSQPEHRHDPKTSCRCKIYIYKKTNPFPSADVFKRDLSAVSQINNRLFNAEAKLTSRRPEDLRRKIREIQTKTDQNRQMATDAREAADAALQDATELEQVSGPKMCVSVSNTGHTHPTGCSDSYVF